MSFVYLSLFIFVLGVALGSLAFWFIFKSKIRDAGKLALSKVESEQAVLLERLQSREKQIEELKIFSKEKEADISQYQE